MRELTSNDRTNNPTTPTSQLFTPPPGTTLSANIQPAPTAPPRTQAPANVGSTTSTQMPQTQAVTSSPSSGLSSSSSLINITPHINSTLITQIAVTISGHETTISAEPTEVSQDPAIPAHNSHLGTILGGVIGGVVVVALAIILVLLIRRQKRRSKTTLAVPKKDAVHPFTDPGTFHSRVSKAPSPSI
jgi:hypothetical protein